MKALIVFKLLVLSLDSKSNSFWSLEPPNLNLKTCDRPSEDVYRAFTSDLDRAIQEFKLIDRMKPFFRNITALQLDSSTETLTDLLQQSAELLEEVCRNSDEINFTPQWSNDTRILKHQTLKFLLDNLHRQ